MRTPFIAAMLTAGLASAAHAQFTTGITRPVFGENPPEAFFTDLERQTNTFLFDIADDLGIPATAPGFTGLAGDDANRRFFATVRNGPQDDIYEFDYDDLFNPTLLFTARHPDGSGQAINGLAYDMTHDVLYGAGRLANALFEIDTDTGTVTQVVDFGTQLGGASSWTVTAIDYCETNDLVYLVNRDTSAQPGRAIWSFDPNSPSNNLELVVELPPYVTGADGLAAGDEKLFLVTSHADTDNGRHTVYDMTTGEFSQPIETPYPAPAGSPIAPIPSGAGAYTPNLLEGEPCIADWNGDGEVDVNDFFAYLSDFEAGDPRADLNNDGEIDINDFFLFLQEFEEGC